MAIKISGHSDDIIMLEGDIEDELTPSQDELADDGVILGFSDGTTVKVTYDDNGIWRITRGQRGRAKFSKEECPIDGESYSDIVTLDGDINWVLMGSRLIS